MSIIKKDNEMPEAFEEFDFYNRANKDEIKKTLRELGSKLKALHQETGETAGGLLNLYAVRRGLKSERGVVMPAYGRLLEAYKWLKKLEDTDRKDEIICGSTDITSLPF